MKIADIRAAIQAKANIANIVPPAPIVPPVQQPVPKEEVAPAKTVQNRPQNVSTFNPPVSNPTVTTATKNNAAPTPATNTATAPIEKDSTPPTPPTPTPVKESKAKTSKTKTAISEDIETIVAKYLRPNIHYTLIPKATKPSLLKGGAEKLAAIFGFRVSCEITNRIEHFDYATPANSFVQYEAKVIVYRDGVIISEGYGSCNSAESKFLKMPFANRINTVLKMSKKRAYVDAILTATCASSVFTQDMEDIANFQETAK